MKIVTDSVAEIYNRMTEDTDKILVITLNSKLSGTREVAKHVIGPG